MYMEPIFKYFLRPSPSLPFTSPYEENPKRTLKNEILYVDFFLSEWRTLRWPNNTGNTKEWDLICWFFLLEWRTLKWPKKKERGFLYLVEMAFLIKDISTWILLFHNTRLRGKNKELEFCWGDPLDGFRFQITSAATIQHYDASSRTQQSSLFY